MKNNIFHTTRRTSARQIIRCFALLIAMLAATLSELLAQCGTPNGGGTSGGGCTGGIVTFNLVNQGVNGPVSHKWYTSSSGGTAFLTTTATQIAPQVWQSTYQTSPSGTTTYYGSSVCNGVESSGRRAVTYTPTSAGYLTIGTGGTPPYRCIGDPITLTPGGGSNYSWSSVPSGASGSGPITVTPNVNTTYTLSGTESVCGNWTSTSITVNVSPKVTQVSTPLGTSSFCQGAYTTSTYTASASNASYYQWNVTPPAAGSANSSGVVTWNTGFNGTATVTVTAFSGSNCNFTTQASTPVYINPIPGTPGVSNVTTTFGTSVTLTATGAGAGESYRWRNASGNIVSNSVNTGSLCSVSNTYTVSIYNASTGCETPPAQRASQTITLTLNPPPSPTISPNTCGTRTVGLPTPPSGVTYYWQGSDPNGQSTSTPIPPSYTLTSSGTFYVRAKTNCMSLWSSSVGFSVTIINPQLPATPTVSPNTCGPKTLTRGTPSDGSSWYWQGTNPSGTDQSTAAAALTYPLNTHGTFTIYIRALLSGCWSSPRSVMVNVNHPVPNLPVLSGNTCGPRTLTKGTPPVGAVLYWQGTNSAGQDHTSLTAVSSTYNVTGNGTYYLGGRDGLGCWAYRAITVDVEPDNITVNTYDPVNSTVQATNSITLAPGFVVPPGSTFIARIVSTAECNDYVNWDERTIYNDTGAPVTSSKSYFDGLGNPLMDQYKDHQSKKVFASQPIYNTFGTAVARTLFAPIIGQEFLYKRNFVRNTDNQPYTASDFDLRTTGAGEVNNPKPVGEQPGSLGWYYSTANNLEPLTAITDFPYSRKYALEGPDPSTEKLAGPGDVFRMGSTHELHHQKQKIAVGELDHYYALRQHFITEPFVFNPNLLAHVSTNTSTYFTANQNVSIGSAAGYVSVTCNQSTSTPGTWPIGGTISVTPGKPYTFRVKGYRSSGSTTNAYLYVVPGGGGPNIVWPGAILPLGSANESWVSNNFTVPAGVTSIKVGILWSGTTAATIGQSFLISGVELYAAVPVASTGYKYTTTDPDGKKVLRFLDADGQLLASARLTGSVVHNWSYSYYNDLGQLIATVAPNGVNTGSNIYPGYVTRYQYDHLGRLIESTSADEGTSRFVYSREGKIRFSENQTQRDATPKRFSYVNYDHLGRTIESGEYTSSSGGYIFEPHTTPTPATNSVLNLVDDVGQSTGLTRKISAQQGYISEYVYLEFDNQAIDFPFVSPVFQENLSGRISKTENGNAVTWYSYDEYGRIVKTWQKITRIEIVNPAVIKTVDYTYDYFGNVVEMAYQKDNPADRFYHHYIFDLNNRLSEVRTSKDGVNKTLHATYEYYLHGPLKRIVLASSLQGIDYAYAVDGSLKTINHADPSRDPGADGTDVFGETLQYFDNDYQGAGYNAGNQTLSGYDNQYSGLVKGVSWHSPVDNHQKRTYAYQYDTRNQLTNAVWGSMSGVFPAYSFATDAMLQHHREAPHSYDRNGNIESLTRKGKSGNTLANYNYIYESGSNRLDKVNHNGVQLVDYTYNSRGQMTVQNEGAAKTFNVSYNSIDLVKEVRNNSNQLVQSNFYDDRGNLLQQVFYNGGAPQLYTTYISDVVGNVLAIYQQMGTTTLSAQAAEVPVYGTGRIALHKPYINTNFYEVNDHLGNVRAVIGVADTETLTATMESEISEEPPFTNIAPRRVPKTPPGTPAGNEMVRLNNQYPAGPGISLKVSPGDVINLSADAYYEAGVLRDHFATSSSLITAIASVFGGVSGAPGEAGNIYNGINYGFGQLFPGGGGGLPPDPDDDDEAPYAYLTYIVFDVNMIYRYGGFQGVSTNANLAIEHLTALPALTFDEPGFIYVFLYNRSESLNWVYFDNLSITHQHSPIVAGGDYYPYGLPMEGREITDEPYRFGYQGQYAEENATTGWNTFDYRNYDARFGRWLSSDPADQFWSPYVGMAGNPVSAFDPDGRYIYFVGRGGNKMMFKALNRLYSTRLGRQIINKYINNPNRHLFIGSGKTRKIESVDLGNGRVLETGADGITTSHMSQDFIANGNEVDFSGLGGKYEYFQNFNGLDLPGFAIGDEVTFITMKSLNDEKRLTKAMGHEIGSHGVMQDNHLHERWAGGPGGRHLADGKTSPFRYSALSFERKLRYQVNTTGKNIERQIGELVIRRGLSMAVLGLSNAGRKIIRTPRFRF